MALSSRLVVVRDLSKFRNIKLNCRFMSKLNTSENDEYTDNPEYPPVHYSGIYPDNAYKKKVHMETLQGLPTVEQKLYAMCKFQKCYMIHPFHPCSDPLPMIQYSTQTHLISHLPKCYDTVDTDSLLSKLRPHFVNAIITEYKQVKRDCQANEVSAGDLSRLVGQGIIRQFSRILFSGLSQDYSHLWNVQVDTCARTEAFWKCEFKGKRFLGVPPHQGQKELKKVGKEVPSVNLTLQFAEMPFLQIRSQLPLAQFVSIDDDLCTKSDVPVVKYHLNAYGCKFDWRYPTLVAGVWKEDPCKFGLVSFYTRERMLDYMKTYGEDDCRDRLTSAGILSSFSWLLSLASLQGFTPYNDVTYPTTTQTVITDGQLWSFFAYQLNTVIPSKDNLLRNICWHSGEMKLFDEITDTEVQGLNDDILKILIKFYCNVPQSRQINLSPYLGEDNMTDEERSTLNYFWPRHYSNRPVEHKETPLYQYIYRENIERFIRRK